MTPGHRWCKFKMVQLLWKTAQRFLEKFKVGGPSDPEIALLGTETRISKSHLYTMFSEALFTVTKRWTQHKRPWTNVQKKKRK